MPFGGGGGPEKVLSQHGSRKGLRGETAEKNLNQTVGVAYKGCGGRMGWTGRGGTRNKRRGSNFIYGGTAGPTEREPKGYGTPKKIKFHYHGKQ